MTLFLTCSRACSQTTEKGVDALRIPSGWVAPKAGYYLSDSAMRDTVKGWTEAREIADVRLQALEALREENQRQSKEIARLLAELETEIKAERKAYRAQIRRGKIQGFAYGLVLGFGGGYLVKKNNP